MNKSNAIISIALYKSYDNVLTSKYETDSDAMTHHGEQRDERCQAAIYFIF